MRTRHFFSIWHQIQKEILNNNNFNVITLVSIETTDSATVRAAMFLRKTLKLSSLNCSSAHLNSKGIRHLIKIFKFDTNT